MSGLVTRFTSPRVVVSGLVIGGGAVAAAQYANAPVQVKMGAVGFTVVQVALAVFSLLKAFYYWCTAGKLQATDNKPASTSVGTEMTPARVDTSSTNERTSSAGGIVPPAVAPVPTATAATQTTPAKDTLSSEQSTSTESIEVPSAGKPTAAVAPEPSAIEIQEPVAAAPAQVDSGKKTENPKPVQKVPSPTHPQAGAAPLEPVSHPMSVQNTIGKNFESKSSIVSSATSGSAGGPISNIEPSSKITPIRSRSSSISGPSSTTAAFSRLPQSQNLLPTISVSRDKALMGKDKMIVIFSSSDFEFEVYPYGMQSQSVQTSIDSEILKDETRTAIELKKSFIHLFVSEIATFLKKNTFKLSVISFVFHKKNGIKFETFKTSIEEAVRAFYGQKYEKLTWRSTIKHIQIIEDNWEKQPQKTNK